MARSSARTPKILTGQVVGSPFGSQIWIMPIVSMAGAIACTSPPTAAKIRAITTSGLPNPSKSIDSTIISESEPWMRSRILSENPPMTAFTTIIVATPSITLTTLASAMYRVRR